MSFSPLPVKFADGCAVVSLPREIDALNADTVSIALLAALDQCDVGVVADMTATSFSDAAGIRAVVRAHHRAGELGCWMRAVIPHPAVRRAAALTGAESLLHTYPSLDRALPRGQRARDLTAQLHPVRDRAQATRSQMSTTWERLAVTCTDIAAIHERLAQAMPHEADRHLSFSQAARDHATAFRRLARKHTS